MNNCNSCSPWREVHAVPTLKNSKCSSVRNITRLFARVVAKTASPSAYAKAALEKGIANPLPLSSAELNIQPGSHGNIDDDRVIPEAE